MTPLNTALAALRQEKAQLERMLGRVNSAIDALTDEPAASRPKKRRKRKRKPMSADAKRAVSERMKEYWAARKK